ncbi:GAF domain-containing protein [Halomicronema sp. CCY15110]|uniref:GAF domain-containing protein n=1 Tax=Halomicronema sp. CCY15110 TaxID=2767773 RepID=UPI0019513C4A|nr:GAF domain-containing protein [Halomicronema sp. CCY15110]
MTLSQIAEQVQELVNAETAVVAVAEAGGDAIFYAAAVGKHAAFIQGKRSPTATSGLCGAVLASGQAALVYQPQTDVRIRQDLAEQLGITTAIAVPVQHDGALVGALMVLNRCDGEAFTPADEQALVEYAGAIGGAIRL